MTKRASTYSFTPFTWGLALLALIYAFEYYTGVSSSVGYVLCALIILWSSSKNPYLAWVGILPTVLIIVGFFMIHNSTDVAIAVNRLLAIGTIWISVIFVKRYRKVAENEDIQKRQLQALFENATEGIIFTNSEGEIVRVNPAAERVFGYGAGELPGKKIEVLIPESFRRTHVAERVNLFAEPKIRPKGTGKELRAQQKDGTEFYTEISLSYFMEGSNVFYIAFIIDVSERKKQQQIIQANIESIKRMNAELDAIVKVRTAELQAALASLESANSELTREISERKSIGDRLLKSQQLYLAIARNFPEGVIGVLDGDMRYVLADGQELRNIGYAGVSPIGQRLFACGDLAVLEQAERQIRKAFYGESVSFDIELKGYVYNLIAVPLPDRQAKNSEVLVVMKNVTERATVERRLMSAIEKERELGALKSRFVTMASHEFRTPLATMQSSVFLLQNYTGEKHEVQRKTHLERVKRSIQTLTELMNDFLSLGSLEEGRIKTARTLVDIHSFLKEAVAELGAIKKPDQRITLSTRGESVTIMTDPQMLTSILRNLVSNAVKYSPMDGPITIQCEQAAREVVITVSDQGMGIPEHEQPEIFKRFYRAENATNIQGTGLGLNIVKKYVKLLNGSIDFTSTVNKGTTFCVRIPLSMEREKQLPV